MKKVLIAITALLCSAISWAQKSDTLRILAIGNSFSVDAVEQNLHEIADGAGDCAIIGNMYIGGCSLERHWKEYSNGAPAYRYCKIDKSGKRTFTKGFTISKALADEKWDVITFQQSSPLSGDFATYEPFLGNLLEVARAAVPGAKLIFHQTWAYAWDSCHPGFDIYDRNKWTMYKSIMKASEQACKKYSLGVIPCGTTIQNVRGAMGGGENVTRDGFHLNFTLGRYAAACTWYAALFKKKATGNPYRIEHMTDEQAILAQVAADGAVANPWRYTNIGFRCTRQNRKEENVGEISLPDPLICYDGTVVRNRKIWENKRAPELLEAFTSQEYGRMPQGVKYFEPEVVEVKDDALDGIATRKRVFIWLDEKHTCRIDMLVYTPKGKERVPLFLGINFKGNEGISLEEDIEIPSLKEMQQRFGCAQRGVRGDNARRWPLKMILERGYGIATFYRGDTFPDHWHCGTKGVQQFYPEANEGPEAWGAISVWAWSLSRAVDYLVTDKDVDPAKIIAIGHSRLGKTALWAGACDKRFAMVVSNDSGCGGSKISRRDFGETVNNINWNFPFWFCDNFKKYNHNVEALPFDQHELISLIAPRPICIASATEDLNADPTGEKMAFDAATPVYDLYKAADKMQYHIRPGGHDIVEYDWKFYLDHADKFIK